MANNKLNLEGQIQQMKSKNIGFNIVKEPEALEYLAKHTYYFRLKHYAENFEKIKKPGVGTRYIALEFAHLKELSLLDLYYRRVMFNIVQDVEHYAKIQLLNALARNKKENGYNIVNEYMEKRKYLDKELSHHQTKYAKGLIEKYRGNFAVWNIIEVQTFSQFIDLYDMYFEKYQQKHVDTKYINVVKNLRNSIAHNNCLMFNLHPAATASDTEDAIRIAVGMGLDEDESREMNHVPFIKELNITLYVFWNIVTSEEEKEFQLELLHDLVNKRFNRHMYYFENNTIVLPVLKYTQKLVKFYFDKICDNHNH
ncbi:Abi family protein [Anaerovibrio lipolyticus]|uniref:Abi family protein n=1 Tax=Anaerovibrio lipolyticus TaxID=82374 RepID=UPI0025EA401C|nr:Abi family protein [Anaerovibrio lipolyticus]